MLRIVAKGNKPALIPLVPRTARTIDLAVGERTEGAILLRHDGHRLYRRTAHRWVRSIGKRADLGTAPNAGGGIGYSLVRWYDRWYDDSEDRR